MGTFAGYYGDMTIPEDKREEFSGRVLTLLTQGGMMGYEKVKLFGSSLPLLTPPKLDEEGRFPHNYNYFEDDAWEDHCYDANTCRFYGGKIGYREFSRVAGAVYVLYEFYTPTFGVAHFDGDVYDEKLAIGWLNYLFHENYTNARLRDPQAIVDVLPEYQREDEKVVDQVQLLCSRFGGDLDQPVETVDTPTFLWFDDRSLRYHGKNLLEWNYHMTDDDRLLFWREGGDVKLSPRIFWWLKDLVEEYQDIMEDEEESIPLNDFLKVFWDTLLKVNRTYLRVYPQAAMFYEFIAHYNERTVQAAVILLQRLCQRYEASVKELYAGGVNWDTASANVTFNPARMYLKRYLAVMGNPALRRKFFRF